MAITYNNLYLDIRQQFLRAGLPDPTLESRELVCCASGKSLIPVFTGNLETWYGNSCYWQERLRQNLPLRTTFPFPL